MMQIRMRPLLVMAAFAFLALVLAPSSADATCAGARANLAFIQQKIGAIRAEARAAGSNEVTEGTRQELARWASVLPRAEQDVAYQCAAAAPPAQGQAVVGPPQSSAPRGSQAAPPLIATPVLTPPPASQPKRAAPTDTVARPPSLGTAPRLPPATIAVRVPAPTDPQAGERSVRSKLNPAQSVAAGAVIMSASQPVQAPASEAALNHASTRIEAPATQKQTSPPLITGTAVRKGATDTSPAKHKARTAVGKHDLADTTPQQSFARPIFKAKNSQ